MNKTIRHKSISVLMILSVTIATLLVFCCNPISAHAQDIDIQLTEQDFCIDQPTAIEIAKLFLQDMINSKETNWTPETNILSTVTLYSSTNSEESSAYGVQLTKGYIVVSAYLDVPNLILEWSDSASPLYEMFDDKEQKRIIYSGPLCYYADCKNGNVRTLDGAIIPAEKISNRIHELRNISNVSKEIIDLILSEKKQMALGGSTPGSDSVITNMYSHASTWYGGTYSIYDYQNKWENYISLHSTSEFSNLGTGYVNHCGPTAITNMLIMYGNRFNVNSIKNAGGANNIFLNVASIGTANLYYVNTNILGMGGTYDTLANNYIKACFNSYGETVTCTTRFWLTYTTVEASLRTDHLMYLTLNGHDCYGNHHLVGYVYYRLFNSTYTQSAIYVKVADGWSSSPRYLDMQSLSTDRFWEVGY